MMMKKKEATTSKRKQQKAVLSPLLIVWIILGIILPSFTDAWTLPQPTGLSPNQVLQLARTRYNSSTTNLLPMEGKVTVITGGAGGIGNQVCRIIHSLGATIVVLDCNEQGLEALEQSLEGRRVWTIVTNQENLNSVADAANRISKKYPQIDLLVNNAGLAYSLDHDDSFLPRISAHGNDLAFTVNYLSHFLLTEKLLPYIRGRIVHVTSSFHWKVDGSEVVPSSVDGRPMAYQSDPSKKSPQHVERSYANTKLAQILHSRCIRTVPSVCACPTWAATGIAGDDSRHFLETFAFSVDNCGPGMTSTLNAIFRTDKELEEAIHGSCFVANSRIIEHLFPEKVMSAASRLGLRDIIATIVALILLIGQRSTHQEFILQRTSPESCDVEKREQLYAWSLKEVEPWL